MSDQFFWLQLTRLSEPVVLIGLGVALLLFGSSYKAAYPNRAGEPVRRVARRSDDRA
jgi:hypothetical protein